MDPVRGFREIVSFLTIFPTGENRLEEAPDFMFLFPVVGMMVGLIAGLSGLLFFRYLPVLVAGSLTFGVLLLITGLHHMDGLMDFGDGLLTVGSPSRKIKAMRDKNLGVGGSVLGFFVLLVSLSAISGLEEHLLGSLVVCEGLAKFAMVFSASVGRSASRGSNTAFIKGMRGSSGIVQLLIGLGIVLILSLWLFELWGIFMIMGTILTALIILLISERSFDGLTGDIFGAINDITRMVLLVLLIIFL